MALRQGDQAPEVAKPPSPKRSDTRPPGRALGCASCRRPITSTAAAIEVSGSHAHTFTNPDDYTFRIGCFSEASGLVKSGPSTLEYTWFAGYSWQVELCGGCREQIGWFYRSADHRFHGLMLDMLVEIEES